MDVPLLELPGLEVGTGIPVFLGAADKSAESLVLLLQGLGLLGDSLSRPLELLDSVPDATLTEGLDGGEIGRCSQLLGRARLFEGCEPAGSISACPWG